MNDVFTVRKGILVIRKFGNRSEAKPLEEALDAAGLAVKIARRSPGQALEAALVHLYSDSTTKVKKHKNKTPKMTTWEVVKEVHVEGNADKNEYKHLFNCTVDHEQNLTFCTNSEGRNLTDTDGKIQPTFEMFLHHVTGAAIGKALSAWMHANGGKPFPPGSGNYFVPQAILDPWRKIAGVIEASAHGGSENRFTELSIDMDQGTIKCLTEDVTEDLNKKLAMITQKALEAASKEGTTNKKFNTLKEEIKGLREIAALYQEELQCSLGSINGLMDIAEAQVVAAALQSDVAKGGAFAGALDAF